ncbi:UNC-like C-terminal-domain-containing protein [Mucor mucedo]|uniref:UNC-like C-terminal-domain-containing protein n=1 Tax=Mucor mucedo TaxID=29922 RepID=UPI00221FFDFC|nr:UNC-like C-terminal-domain-containing protein [Mucor mucedo]KAI7888312.1 UNC-like C-terminal-domain-containing protein [Mucor mucedo]
MIQTALQTYHQDVLNKADFASIFRHARIVHSLTSHTYSRYPIWKQSILRFFALSPFENTPYEAIKPSTHIGECWSMYGSYGTLGIRLSQPIIIQSISIDYPSSQMMAGNMSKAPRKLELFGINKGANVSLGTAEYDIYDDHAIQTFDMNPTKENESPIVYGIVQLHIKSNWGNPNCTEIYRVRIHGIPPPIIEEKRND